MMIFTSCDSYEINMSNRASPRPNLKVYTVDNPTDVTSCDSWEHLIGQTVLLDGVERVVVGVEAFKIGGVYHAGRPIGLAVEEVK